MSIIISTAAAARGTAIAVGATNVIQQYAQNTSEPNDRGITGRSAGRSGVAMALMVASLCRTP